MHGVPLPDTWCASKGLRRSTARIESRLVSEFRPDSRKIEEAPACFRSCVNNATLTILGNVSQMETAMATGSNFMLDIHRQLAARNAVEVHAFQEITTDYQRCLSQLRELRVRSEVLFASTPPNSWIRHDFGMLLGLC